MKLKQFTIQDIRNDGPCYDPGRYGAENWVGNALDILKHPEIPAKDKIWIIKQDGRLSDAVLRQFACWCATETLLARRFSGFSVGDKPWGAIKASLDFAAGLITKEQLAADADAAAAAYAAYAAAAAHAADAAAYTAAYAADAAAYAAYAADAADAAAYAAYAADAADAAARNKQVSKLIQMIEQDYVYDLNEFYNHA